MAYLLFNHRCFGRGQVRFGRLLLGVGEGRCPLRQVRDLGLGSRCLISAVCWFVPSRECRRGDSFRAVSCRFGVPL